MAKHVKSMAALIYHSRSMKKDLVDARAIGILVSSIKVLQLFPATAAIKTLAEKIIRLKVETRDLIEEAKLVSPSKLALRTDGKTQQTPLVKMCLERSHQTEQRFFLFMNPNSRLKLPEGSKPKINDFKKKSVSTKQRSGHKTAK